MWHSTEFDCLKDNDNVIKHWSHKRKILQRKMQTAPGTSQQNKKCLEGLNPLTAGVQQALHHIHHGWQAHLTLMHHGSPLMSIKQIPIQKQFVLFVSWTFVFMSFNFFRTLFFIEMFFVSKNIKPNNFLKLLEPLPISHY